MLALFVGACAVAFVFWSVLPGEFRENQSSDYLGTCEPVARSIVAGRGITIDGEIAVRYPPGFSVLLAGLFRTAAALGVAGGTMLLAFRLLCVGLSVVLVYGLARLVWSPGLALIPALAWMTYPFFLWLTKQPNSEVPFFPVLSATFFLFWWGMLRGRGGALRSMTGGNWLIVLYFWGMTFIVIPLLRYMVPVIGLLMLTLPGVYLSLAQRRSRAARRVDAPSIQS